MNVKKTNSWMNEWISYSKKLKVRLGIYCWGVDYDDGDDVMGMRHERWIEQCDLHLIKMKFSYCLRRTLKTFKTATVTNKQWLLLN